MPEPVLIANVELLANDFSTSVADVRIEGGRVLEIGQLKPSTTETVVEGGGGLLIPGLHDHHVHLAATAAALISVSCGPPVTNNAEELINQLASAPGRNWLRGVGYFESVAGDIDRDWLDQHGPDRPVRIQHRTGQLWMLNSKALDLLDLPAAPSDGRLFGGDLQLRSIEREEPPIELVSRQLASFGVTGVNDMTVSNDRRVWRWFHQLQLEGNLLQRVRLSGGEALSTVPSDPQLSRGETKLYLHDHQLPSFDDLVADIRVSHEAGRAVAFHCVTEAELVFALAALREAKPGAGDRIEHGSVIPETLIEQLLELKVTLVTQPNFIAERGDSYQETIDESEHDNLYRCASLMTAGVPVAFGTDTPYGDCDPWKAMQAAVQRKTRRGHVIGAGEAVSPETAFAAFLGELDAPARVRWIEPGGSADLCLLSCNWADCRENLSAEHVRTTWRQGEVIYSRD